MPEINSQLSSPDEGKQSKQVTAMHELSPEKIEKFSESAENDENASAAGSEEMKIGSLVFAQKELASSISCKGTGLGTLSTKSGTEDEKALSLTMLL